jgi:hydrocephalus-inducing protein
MFQTVRKNRPQKLPESLLSKTFVQAEGVFDFGPLLIGKNPENKNKKQMLQANSTLIKLHPKGNFASEIEFALLSSIMENDPVYKKGVFLIDESVGGPLVLDPAGPAKEIRVWAIPDSAQVFKDELIIMLKNNPLPEIVPITCLGAKPQIDVEGNPMKFNRILVRQNIKKELKLKNTGSIPIKWRIEGTEALP